jgi:hypothetical protein
MPESWAVISSGIFVAKWSSNGTKYEMHADTSWKVAHLEELETNSDEFKW